MYNSEISEKAFFERLEQRTPALDAARGSAAAQPALSSSQYDLFGIVVPMTSDRIRPDDHLGELRDALAQMSFTLMAVLTEVAAEHDLSRRPIGTSDTHRVGSQTGVGDHCGRR